MPQDIPYPGETHDEFLRRMQRQQHQSTLPFQFTPMTDTQFEGVTQAAIEGRPVDMDIIPQAFKDASDRYYQRTVNPQGGAVFQLHGPNADLRPDFSGYRTPLTEIDPSQIPFDLIDMSGDPRQRSVGESRGSQRPGPLRFDFSLGQSPFAADLESPGITATLGQSPFAPDYEGPEITATLGPVLEWMFGPAEQPSRESTDIQAPPLQGAFAPQGQEGGAGGVSVRGGQGGQSFERTVQIPSPADDIIGDPDIPVLTREQLDEATAGMRRGIPDDFEREDISQNQLLASIGAALAEAGRAPTLGQALLAAGTGGVSGIAQHEQQQDQLARERELLQDEAQRQLARFGLEGERARVSSGQSAERIRQQYDRIRANIENRRSRLINSMFNVSTSGDNVVMTAPTDIQDGEVTVETKVLNTGSAAGGSAWRSVASGNFEDLELPDIGGEPGEKRLALAATPQERVLNFASMKLVDGGLPASRVQPVKVARQNKDGETVVETVSGKRYVNGIEQEAWQEMGRMLGMDPQEATQASVMTQWNARAGGDSLSAAEMHEDIMYQKLNDHMAINPSFANAVLTGIGFRSQQNGGQ